MMTIFALRSSQATSPSLESEYGGSAQSIWPDNITRGLLMSTTLRRYIDDWISLEVSPTLARNGRYDRRGEVALRTYWRGRGDQAVTATAANVNDARVLPALLHGEETAMWGDQGLSGATGGARRACAQGRGSHLPALAVEAPRLA